jgi:predicted metal-dependent peptidase
VKRVKEFVIAIDTSGSCSGETVEAFINKTYNILKQGENFFTKINVHIVQCDSEIQDVVKVTNQQEFEHYLQTMQLKGFGGTDFRPVFDYVDAQIQAKEFTDLKGLIYFTDGYGTFPAKKPNYHTAFVFLEEDYGEPKVPNWAIKLVLTKDEI